MSSRPVKRTRTEALKEPGLELPRAIKGVQKTQEGFMKAVAAVETLIQDVFEGLEMKLERKQRELSELDADFIRKKNANRIAVDQDLAAYGYEGALKILSQRGEKAVNAVEDEKLKSERETLSHRYQQSEQEAVEAEKQRGHRHLQQMLETTKLQQEAAVAKVEAQLEQKDREIAVLRETITGLKEDLEKQRQLTKSVADAARPQYVQAPLDSRR